MEIALDLPFVEMEESREDESCKLLPFHAASILTEPACKVHEFARRIKIVEVLNPTDSKIRNFVRKCFLAIAIVVLAYIALFTTLPGIAIRGVATYVQKSSFTYLKGNPDKEKILQGNKFSLLSWNVCCVPAGYAITNGNVMPWRYRIDAIINEIKMQNADAVSLYEIFDADASRYLYKRLKEEYPHFYVNIGPRALGVSSGFFVASKYDIRNPEFTPFPKSTLVGRTKKSEKGVFSFDLQSRKHSFARIFATHLQHSNASQFPTDPEIQGRKAQMELIAQKVIQVKNRAALLTGDLNMDETELSASPHRHLFTKGTFPENEKTWGGDQFCASLVGDRPSEPLTLDHTLALNNGSVESIETTYVDTGFNGKVFDPNSTSDHKGVLSIVTLQTLAY